jgi:hypothetical protein
MLSGFKSAPSEVASLIFTKQGKLIWAGTVIIRSRRNLPPLIDSSKITSTMPTLHPTHPIQAQASIACARQTPGRGRGPIRPA